MLAVAQPSPFHHPDSQLGAAFRYVAGLAFGVLARLFWQDWAWLHAKALLGLEIKAR